MTDYLTVNNLLWLNLVQAVIIVLLVLDLYEEKLNQKLQPDLSSLAKQIDRLGEISKNLNDGLEDANKNE